jgi:hypothetical protein
MVEEEAKAKAKLEWTHSIGQVVLLWTKIL